MVWARQVLDAHGQDDAGLAARPEAVADFDLEPAIQLFDLLGAAVLNGHPKDRKATATPLGVAVLSSARRCGIA